MQKMQIALIQSLKYSQLKKCKWNTEHGICINISGIITLLS